MFINKMVKIICCNVLVVANELQAAGILYVTVYPKK